MEDDLAVFSLAMVQRALLAAGRQLHAFEPLVALVHTELFAAMVHVVRQPSLGVINGVNQVGGGVTVCGGGVVWCDGVDQVGGSVTV